MSGPKRPTKVSIGPLDWRLKYDAKRLKEGSHIDGVLKYGVTLPDQVDIVVDPDRPEQGIRDTVFHELLHAIIWTCGVPLADDDEETEEGLVAALSSALLDMLRRNPELVAYLTADGAS